MIEIVSPGPLCTVQDSGRVGLAHIGVARSGAVDRRAYELANRLVGNPVGAAAFEITFGGAVFAVRVACLVAIAGAACPTIVSSGGVTVSPFDLGDQRPVAVPAGSLIAFAAPSDGLRTYLAVRGGLSTTVELGSRSMDMLSGLGGQPLRSGDTIAIGPDPSSTIPTEAAPRSPASTNPIQLWPGPRQQWFERSSVDDLVTSPYVMLPTSNRIGARLSGCPLSRSVATELPSEGMIEGAVQVPADGQPLIFLADHPTTGGYPVIAVVDDADIGRIGQLRPGDAVTFQWARRSVV